VEFESPTHGRITTEEVISKISLFVESEPQGEYRVVIGTDSQSRSSNGVKGIDFVSAVIVHRRGHGAKYFWRKVKGQKEITLRDKIYRETAMSLELAEVLVPELRKKISPAKYDLEIHIDVGPLGDTRSMIREVVGMVNGSGYTARTKPESWGASSVADKHT